MNSEAIRILVVDAEPAGEQTWPVRLEGVEGIRVVGVAQDRRAAQRKAESLKPDVLLIDLMLPRNASIEAIRHIGDRQPKVRMLALTPADPPHDKVLLAAKADVLGHINKESQPGELAAAIRQVHQGEPWLPARTTYQVLQDAADELEVTSKERRDRLTEVILGLVPLSGAVAAILAFLTREYWRQVGVRVSDLGVNPGSRVVDIFLLFLLLIGLFGPLLFVGKWLDSIGAWLNSRQGFSDRMTHWRALRLGRLHFGRLVFNRWLAWVLLALLVLSVTFVLADLAPLVLVLFVGPAIAVVLLASVLGLTDELPALLEVPRLDARRVVVVAGLILLIFVFALGVEVWLIGPDLQTDGIHGILAPTVLGVSGRPVLVVDEQGKKQPEGALYLGGIGEIYVLYDPCESEVKYISTGDVQLEIIDQVHCR
jgi:DNA-binding NarL/FixJ family response regulator